MGALVDAVSRVIELLVLGGLGVGLIVWPLWFILNRLEEKKFWHGESWGKMKGYLASQEYPRAVRLVVIGCCLAIVYFIGVVTNAYAFSVVKTRFNHSKLVYDTREKCESVLPKSEKYSNGPAWNESEAKSKQQRKEFETLRANLASTYDELRWRNQNLDAYRHVMDDLLRFLRLTRGAIPIAACYIGVGIVMIVLSSVFKRSVALVFAMSSLVISSILLFVLCHSYVVVEKEYHEAIYFGQAAVEKPSME